MPTVPANLVDDCVELVQFGAFTGDASLLAMWDEAGQDVGALHGNCSALGEGDPAKLESMSAQWTDVQTFLAASQTTREATTVPPTPPPTAPPTTAAPPPTLPPPTAPAPLVVAPPADCGEGSYVNVDGNCIPSPVSAPSAPAGATAQCNDGTYSFSQHRSGTCSHHGGVAVWL